ncbi:MAG: type II secretion system protein GspE [Candidatus Omnitrophica bacterium CG11_big_fil_rev_8_21_14_0_20_45_26]|uniref:Type II secretion system protein GspE n=1 Tax=Candidatus Abzuiibacterium crystallinum TaxID=1974748 RepID=A0A2H0LRG3_9BACT|nr:MAG: type II secretion system protein GspE [Candidatus Omnitrophica bacterium CG11_big_fil_rev_8_21_14_0_20_45_26]PIW65569.1 MAG: type II secretion system protein GspE [Candidatus Omnitrophica bacterium CG12_big_fil_rev_8_21_14_0_65_45_16]
MNLGSILKERGLLNADQLIKAESYAQSKKIPLGSAIQRLNLAAKEQIYMTVAESIGVPYVDLSSYEISPDCTKLIAQETARRYRAIPLFKIQQTLTVAMEDPTKLAAIDRIRHESKMEIELCLAAPEDVQEALDRYFGVSGTISKLLASLDAEDKVRRRGSAPPKAKPLSFEATGGEQPIVQLVNLIVEEAVERGASDIHIEPEANELRVRYRIDGVLQEAPSPPKHYESAIVSRLKVLANLDIAETRMPQDGQMKIQVKSRAIDIRVSVVPTIYGENAVLRILDTNRALLDLKQLGFADAMLHQFEELIRKSYGMILVTGPTGSGKTTSLYAALTAINSVERSIVTIEDPVEFKLSLIRQIQVNPKAQLTFANGLRSIVRQDPDVIMVGEIRDSETAHIATQAALTGHLVFSTLHTQNAAGAITRLDDMGVEPFYISSSLLCVVAQRLVRTICGQCKKTYDPPSDILNAIPAKHRSEMKFYKGKGCQKCQQTGYRGRIGIFELLRMTDAIRRMIAKKAVSADIQQQAEADGMQTLFLDGLEKVKAGITTIDEILKVM